MTTALRTLSTLIVAGLLAFAVSACSTAGKKPKVNDEIQGDSIGQANEG